MWRKNNFQIYRTLTYALYLSLWAFSARLDGTLAGGRPNAFSEGQNAFAGVVNPANAVWLPDRIDIGGFWQYQKSSLDNRDNNPRFSLGKTDLTYKTKNLFSADAAVHKQMQAKIGTKQYDYSLSFATYTTPSSVKLHTKRPAPNSGTTPIFVYNKVQATSLIFSFKLTPQHAFGVSVDYFYFSHERNGFQHADNPLRSVSPGNVTNNGRDHSSGIGVTIGWRSNLTKRLSFGTAWVKKSYCGQYRRYRGYEPHHAKNYIPQLIGAGFSYRFTSKIAGRLEMIWSNLGNVPAANNNILPNGKLNLNKRGSSNSPGPGQQDATFINVGVGYKWNAMLSLGASFSHRIRLHKSSNILSHTYTLQTIYDLLSFGANIKYQKHDIFLTASYGFKNRVSGHIPETLGGGHFIGERQTTSLSISWGYLY